MGIKLKKIDRVPTSLKELIDVDSSTGIPRCVDCIANGMVLVASVSTIYKKDTFVFKNLSDIIKVGQGMQATLVNGVMTISSSLESLNLNDLFDVSINDPADDDVLTYNSVLQRWENTANGWVPTSTLITINGVTQDLSANRTWTIPTGSGTVTSVTGTGTVSGLTLSGSVTTAGNLTLGGTLVLTSGNITSGLGYTPYDASNPANYITSSALSAYLTIASASSTYLTQVLAQSTYQPIFTTQNGLTYGGGNLELGGSLIKNTIIAGNGTGGPYYLYLQRFSELKLNADDGSDTTEIKLLPTEIQVKTPLYGSKSVGDVLTLKDPATGEVEFETPATGSGGLQYGVASGTNTYTVTISGVTGYTDGDTYVVKFTNGSDDDSTININGLGAKTLVKEFNIQLTGGDIVSGQDLIIIYDGTNFQTLGVAPNQLFAYVTNDDSVTINKGQPVYAAGAAGNRMSVKLAYNTGDATSAQTVGVVFSSSIAAGQKGFIITQGVISGVNTAAYSPGNQLYLGATAGSLTATKPHAPNHLVYIGIVERANAGGGQIYVKPQNGYELDEIHDVDLVSTAPVNNDVLVFDTSTTPDLWKPKSIPTILGYTPANIDSPAFTGTPTAPTAASGTNTTQIATTAFVQNMAVQSASLIAIFGDGTSGAATITGPLSLGEDTYYTDLTVSGGGSINLNGYRMFVNGTLDLSNAGANAIYNNGLTGNSGTVTSQTGVRGGLGVTVSGYGAAATGIALSGASGAGGSANTNNASAGAAPAAIAAATRHNAGGAGGAGSAGGNSLFTGAAGGTGQVTSTSPSAFYLRTLSYGGLNTIILRTTVVQTTTAYGLVSVDTVGGRHGGGGGGGSSSAVASGKSGGSGGSGGGIAVIYARQIIVGASTNAAAISARGGTGGAGGTSGFTNQAGGGGGGGGGGGYVYLVYGSITGGSYTFVTADGGVGGAGSNGNGSATGGTGGFGGNGGRITAISLGANTITQVDGTANAAATPTTATTSAGTAGTAGGTCTFSS
jgi:hypothetical protein